jgi:hypothetical protein
MKFSILKFTFFLLIFSFASASAYAQIDASTPNGTPRKEDLPKNIKETLKKHEIERNRKNHDEMLKSGEEAFQLSEELVESFEKSNQLSAKDLAKLEKIEKIVKKIRTRLGGGDEDSKEEIKPSTLEAAVKTLRETTGDLLEELKKTTRYSISVVAIQSSNSLLGIVRLLRFWDR